MIGVVCIVVGVWDLGDFDLRATESQSLIMGKW